MGASALITWSQILAEDRWRLSPHLAPWQKKIVQQLRARTPRDPDLFWILSSGTQSVDEVKAIALGERAFLASAAAVNRHLGVAAGESWLLTLPLYHVGGLGILARAHLSSSPVFHLRNWSAGAFCEIIDQHRISLSALVPTQIFDLVKARSRAPSSLRAIVVGGAALDPQLYRSARALGWPLLPSYGLTETGSQIATASLTSLATDAFPDLAVLKHADVELRDGRVFVRADSLCRFIARGDRDGQFTLEDPLRQGWLPTEDLAEWRADGLRIVGRRDDIVKVMGVLVPIMKVEHEARAYFESLGRTGEVTVVATPGGREGHRLVLVTDSTDSLADWERAVANFNLARAFPERLHLFCWTAQIPRGDLGKVKRKALLASLNLT